MSKLMLQELWVLKPSISGNMALIIKVTEYICSIFLCFYSWILFSVKHSYDGKWDGSKTRLTTCDPHAKRTITSSNSPQEVEDKEIIFTYDVEFQVKLSSLLWMEYICRLKCELIIMLHRLAGLFVGK